MKLAALFQRHLKAFFLVLWENVKTTKVHIFEFNIACTTKGTLVPIVVLFLMSVSIIALASRRRQKIHQHRILHKFYIFPLKNESKAFD